MRPERYGPSASRLTRSGNRRRTSSSTHRAPSIRSRTCIPRRRARRPGFGSGGIQPAAAAIRHPPADSQNTAAVRRRLSAVRRRPAHTGRASGTTSGRGQALTEALIEKLKIKCKIKCKFSIASRVHGPARPGADRRARVSAMRTRRAAAAGKRRVACSRAGAARQSLASAEGGSKRSTVSESNAGAARQYLTAVTGSRDSRPSRRRQQPHSHTRRTCCGLPRPAAPQPRSAPPVTPAHRPGPVSGPGHRCAGLQRRAGRLMPALLERRLAPALLERLATSGACARPRARPVLAHPRPGLGADPSWPTRDPSRTGSRDSSWPTRDPVWRL